MAGQWGWGRGSDYYSRSRGVPSQQCLFRASSSESHHHHRRHYYYYYYYH